MTSQDSQSQPPQQQPPPPLSPQQAAVITVAGGVLDSLKAQPILLTVIVLNCIMIASAAWMLSVHENSRHKEWVLFINRCLAPNEKPTAELP
jgi:hypothetical protein